jgi:hypothetical protein
MSYLNSSNRFSVDLFTQRNALIHPRSKQNILSASPLRGLLRLVQPEQVINRTLGDDEICSRPDAVADLDGDGRLDITRMPPMAIRESLSGLSRAQGTLATSPTGLST